MNTRFSTSSIAALCFSAILAGCSTAPVEQPSTDIEDTPVQAVQIETSETEQTVVEIEQTIQAETVFYFAYDKALLKSESRAALVEHATALTNNPRTVRLEGHADERGTREYNMALGERRANAVKEFLVLQGVSADLIEVISYGEERAASYGSNESAWSLNRRVELK